MPSTIILTIASATCAGESFGGGESALAGVSTVEGKIAQTLMPHGSSSARTPCVSDKVAALLAQYDPIDGRHTCAKMLSTLTTMPCLRCLKTGTSARMVAS